MIIFGTRGITYSTGDSEFFCPNCQSQKPYSRKRVRRFFTLYFIPLIPLDLLGEYIECRECRNTYKLEVLTLDPNAGRAEFEAEFHLAIKRVMAAMIIADGAVDEKEITMIQEIYKKLTGTDLTKEAVEDEIKNVKSDTQGIAYTLENIASNLNDTGKEMVVRAAFLIATADGEFADEEKKLLAVIGKSLCMSSSHMKGVLSEMMK